MKKLIPILATGFLLVSCDAIEGTLKVNEELTLKAKKTGLFQSGTKDLAVPAATYEAKLNPTSETNINLEIKVGGKDKKIPFKMKKGTQLPEVEGRLDIIASENGQNYDLQANVRTDVSSSNFSQNETCVSHYVQQRRCTTTPGTRSCTTIPGREVCEEVRRNGNDRPGNNPRGPRYNPPGETTRVCRQMPARQECVTRPPVTNCFMESVPVYGNQIVNYERITSVKHIDVDLLAAGSAVAQFNNVSSSSRNVRMDSTICR